MSIILNILLVLFIIIRERKAINKGILLCCYYVKRHITNTKRSMCVQAVGVLKKTLDKLSIKVEFNEDELSNKQIAYLNSKGYNYYTQEDKEYIKATTLPEEEQDTDVFTISMFVASTNNDYFEIIAGDIKGKTHLELNMAMFGSHNNVLKDKRLLCALDSVGKRVYFSEDIYNQYADILAPYYSMNRKRKKMGLNPFVDSKSYILFCKLTKEQVLNINSFINELEKEKVRTEAAATKETTTDLVVVNKTRQAKETITPNVIALPGVVADEWHIKMLNDAIEIEPEKEQFYRDCIKLYTNKEVEENIMVEDLKDIKTFYANVEEEVAADIIEEEIVEEDLDDIKTFYAPKSFDNEYVSIEMIDSIATKQLKVKKSSKAIKKANKNKKTKKTTIDEIANKFNESKYNTLNDVMKGSVL